MAGILIGIAPPTEISENIKTLMGYIVNQTKTNLYGLHDPHITIWLNSFPDFNTVESLVMHILKGFSPFTIEVQGIDVFDDGPNANSKTFVYRIKRNNTLTRLQRELVRGLTPLMDNHQADFCVRSNPELARRKSHNIKKYGYWFGPKDWIFHATIGSVPNKYFEIIREQILKYLVSKKYPIGEIGIYFYDKNKGGVLFRKYKLFQILNNLTRNSFS